MYVREVFFTMSLHDIYHQKLRAIRHIDRCGDLSCVYFRLSEGCVHERRPRPRPPGRSMSRPQSLSIRGGKRRKTRPRKGATPNPRAHRGKLVVITMAVSLFRMVCICQNSERTFYKLVILTEFPPGVLENWKISTMLAPLRACLLYTSPSPRDRQKSRMPSSA